MQTRKLQARARRTVVRRLRPGIMQSSSARCQDEDAPGLEERFTRRRAECTVKPPTFASETLAPVARIHARPQERERERERERGLSRATELARDDNVLSTTEERPGIEHERGAGGIADLGQRGKRTSSRGSAGRSSASRDARTLDYLARARLFLLSVGILVRDNGVVASRWKYSALFPEDARRSRCAREPILAERRGRLNRAAASSRGLPVSTTRLDHWILGGIAFP